MNMPATFQCCGLTWTCIDMLATDQFLIRAGLNIIDTDIEYNRDYGGGARQLALVGRRRRVTPLFSAQPTSNGQQAVQATS